MWEVWCNMEDNISNNECVHHYILEKGRNVFGRCIYCDDVRYFVPKDLEYVKGYNSKKDVRSRDKTK